MDFYDPWEHLPDGVTVIRRHLATAPAYTDGSRVIWLDAGLTQAEERCALTHELVHLERGHTGHQKAGVECKVRAEVARRLLGATDVVDLERAPAYYAEEHGVTVAVVHDRIRAERGSA